MDEEYLYNSKTKKRICKLKGYERTYREMLIGAGINPEANPLVDLDGEPFNMDDLCIQYVHSDYF